MNYVELAWGVLIGAVLSFLNFYILSYSVRKALVYKDSPRVVLFVLGSYILRYVMIGAVILLLGLHGYMPMALTILLVLGSVTIVWALMQCKKNNSRNREL